VYVCHQSVKLSTEFFRSANPIFDKLGISNHVELVLYAVSNPKGNSLTSSESREEKPLSKALGQSA
jgi:hypothetical protein